MIMACIQSKFSAQDALTLLGWADSYTCAVAMQKAVSDASADVAAAGATSCNARSFMQSRVAIVLAARRRWRSA